MYVPGAHLPLLHCGRIGSYLEDSPVKIMDAVEPRMFKSKTA
jgi:hypothetical protein